MNDYNKQAENFLTSTNSTLTTTFREIKTEPGTSIADDRFTECKARLAFDFTIKRGERSTSGTYTGSIRDCYEILVGEAYPANMTLHTEALHQSNALLLDRQTARRVKKGTSSKDLPHPRPYDILSCLQKYEVDADVDAFAAEYGYRDTDTPIKEILRIHAACLAEYSGLLSLYNDAEMAMLQEIN